MKKFKKSIEISTENISDVLQVPIVTSVYKTKLFKNPFIEGRSNPYDALAVMYVHVEGIKSIRNMAKTDFRCKDCIFYLNETCKHSDEYRTTCEENVACENFEWVNIKF